MSECIYSADRVAADVLSLLIGAARASVRMDLTQVVDGLAGAVELYEQHPSAVHSSHSELRKVLALIRYAAGVHRKLDLPERRLQTLEARAEALRKPLH